MLLASATLFAAVRYDSRGNMIEDASGNHYTFDAKDNRLSKTDTAGRTETWTYDKDSNVKSYTDYLGNVTTY